MRLHEEIYKFIRDIWREEKMPKEWEEGMVVTIYKKEDHVDCINYRGVTLPLL